MSTKTTEWENIKVRRSVVNKLRSHKKKTGVSIMAFTEKAILEKLDVAKRWHPLTPTEQISKTKK